MLHQTIEKRNNQRHIVSPKQPSKYKLIQLGRYQYLPQYEYRREGLNNNEKVTKTTVHNSKRR